MSKLDTLPSYDDIYRWYCCNGAPTREEVRNDKVALPDGVSKTLIEALLPYFNTNRKDKPLLSIPKFDDKEESSIVVASDFHIPFQDVAALRTFINFLAEYAPDELVLNGNINDCSSFSTHPKLRDVATAFRTAREERENWFPIAELLREVLPDTKITYVGSQCHEGWIDNWASLSPVTADDYNYTIPGWFKLEDFGIDYVPEVYDLLGNSSLLITHGTVARGKGGASAYATMEMEGTSIIQGHTHRLAQVFKTTSIGETVAIEGGCLCQRTPWYHLKGRRLMMDWQQGFVLVNTKGNSFSTQCIPIIRDDNDRPYFWVGKDRYK